MSVEFKGPTPAVVEVTVCGLNTKQTIAPSDASDDISKKIIIGTVTAAIGATLFGAGYLLYKRRQAQQHQANNELTASLNPMRPN